MYEDQIIKSNNLTPPSCQPEFATPITNTDNKTVYVEKDSHNKCSPCCPYFHYYFKETQYCTLFNLVVYHCRRRYLCLESTMLQGE